MKYIICLVNFSCFKSSSVRYLGLRHYERLLYVYEKFHIDNVFIEISDWLLLTFEFARESDNLSDTTCPSLVLRHLKGILRLGPPISLEWEKN